MNSDTHKGSTLDRLLQTLQAYLDAVPRQKLPNPPDLLAIFAQLDALEKELKPSDSAQLRHYMYQKSYRKAYNFLTDQESENVKGNCGR